jgi:hypothetical protein
MPSQGRWPRLAQFPAPLNTVPFACKASPVQPQGRGELRAQPVTGRHPAAYGNPRGG